MHLQIEKKKIAKGKHEKKIILEQSVTIENKEFGLNKIYMLNYFFLGIRYGS